MIKVAGKECTDEIIAFCKKWGKIKDCAAIRSVQINAEMNDLILIKVELMAIEEPEEEGVIDHTIKFREMGVPTETKPICGSCDNLLFRHTRKWCKYLKTWIVDIVDNEAMLFHSNVCDGYCERGL